MQKEKEKSDSEQKEGRLEISQVDNRKTIERINKTKVGFVRRLIKLENFSQTDHENKTKQNKKKRKIQITKVRNESGDSTTNFKEIKMNKREL